MMVVILALLLLIAGGDFLSTIFWPLVAEPDVTGPGFGLDKLEDPLVPGCSVLGVEVDAVSTPEADALLAPSVPVLALA